MQHMLEVSLDLIEEILIHVLTYKSLESCKTLQISNLTEDGKKESKPNYVAISVNNLFSNSTQLTERIFEDAPCLHMFELLHLLFWFSEGHKMYIQLGCIYTQLTYISHYQKLKKTVTTMIKRT